MSDIGDYYGQDASSSGGMDLLVRNVSKLPNVAFFVWNEENGEPIYVSAQLPKFYRLSMAEFLATYGTNEKISANMVGDDGARYLAATRAGMAAAGSYEVEFRFHRADRTICFAREVGEYIRDPASGRVIRCIGALIDITALKETEATLRRMSEELQARTEELSASLDQLRATQDRLVQTEKLASLGQLTAGIAHEIKNPLNFVNNFSSLSIELVDELREILAAAPIDATARESADEIADMLKGNLEKVAQHGRRADSIVKNMLLHSRAGSGEHRPQDVNAIVEESLNLAYHGARAERQDFDIALETSFDPAAGEVDLYPQEIARVLINLISNGFYATAKRKAEEGDALYRPLLAAATRNLGDRVEIRIRDNGTGIPPHVRARIFHPFFTTKPAGEGTGLGLSLSHDIVVKQHGGAIEVETEPGAFTEFTIVLPRDGAARADAADGG